MAKKSAKKVTAMDLAGDAMVPEDAEDRATGYGLQAADDQETEFPPDHLLNDSPDQTSDGPVAEETRSPQPAAGSPPGPPGPPGPVCWDVAPKKVPDLVESPVMPRRPKRTGGRAVCWDVQ